jgi:hypothetical protein
MASAAWTPGPYCGFLTQSPEPTYLNRNKSRTKYRVPARRTNHALCCWNQVCCDESGPAEIRLEKSEKPEIKNIKN